MNEKFLQLSNSTFRFALSHIALIGFIVCDLKIINLFPLFFISRQQMQNYVLMNG